MPFATCFQVKNRSRCIPYLRLLAGLLCVGWCAYAANAQSVWRSSADSAKAFLTAGNSQKAYNAGLRGAMQPKPVQEADSVWAALTQLSHQLSDSVSAVTLLQAGVYYLTCNELDRAEPYLTNAISEGKRLQLPACYMNGYLLKARLKLMRNAMTEAAQLYTTLLGDPFDKRDPNYGIEALLGLTDIHLAAYQIDSATTTAQRAMIRLKAQPSFTKTRFYPIVKLQLARCSYTKGNLTKAIEDIEESYSIARVTMPTSPAFLAISNYYTLVMSDINDEKALEATQTARQLLQKQPNYTRHPYYLTLLRNEIGMLRTLDRNKEAVSVADSVLQQHPFDELQQLYGYTAFLSELNRTYISAARKDTIEHIAQRAQKMLSSEGLNSVDSSYMFGILGRYYQYKHDHVRAIHALKEELRLDGAKEGISYFNHSLKNRLAICQARAGQRTDSYASFGQLVQEFDSNARHNLWLMSDAERDNYVRTSVISSLFYYLLNRDDPNPDELGLAYNYKLLRQGVRLKISRSINRFMHNQGGIRPTYLDQLGTIRTRLADRSLRKKPGEEDQLRILADSLERLMGNAALASSKAYKPAQWQDIRARLKPGEAAVELIWYNNHELTKQDSNATYYSALLLRPEWDAPKVVHIPVPDEELNKHTAEEIALWGTADYYLNHIYSAKNQRAQFDQFWQPIAHALGPINRIYIALDGNYQKISLPTLYNHRTARYLLDDLDIVLVNSTQDILEKPQLSPNHTAELIGHPAYNLTSKSIRISRTISTRQKVKMRNGLTFDELPYTKIEINQLAKLLRSAQLSPRVRLDTAATEGAFARLKAPKLIHVATHGFYLDSSSRMASSELLTCGLLLAGAADTTRQLNKTDGILTGYEASLLNLHGTELVTLSACETGAGDFFEGEGVHGLQRAFLLAGAQSVLMSLWKVNDQITQQLMKDFYRYWLAGSTKPQALRKAQVKLRKQYPEPYYWGAFALLGQ